MAASKPSKLTGRGLVSFWGVTPALNVLSYETSEVRRSDKEEWLNVLLCSPGDCRHVLKTTAVDRCAKKDSRLKFYLLHPTLENIARDLLLFSIAFESTEVLGYHAKVELFLEIFGDLKIREQTRQFLQKKTEELIRLVTDDKHGKEEFCLFDLSHLRYKDKDELEKIFKKWTNVKKDDRDYTKSWEARSRRDLEARYDHRVGAYDWDYAMNLSDVGGKMITGPVYYRWRETGIAFESRDSAVYSLPNKTLLTSLSVSQKDNKYDMEGYWGDMVTSPFVAFGLGEDALKYRQVRNDTDAVSSEMASQKVLMDYLQMIFTGEKPESSPEKKEATITEITGNDEADGGDGDAVCDWKSRYRIVFLPPVNNSVISHKEKYQGLFDIAYVGGHSLLDSLTGLMRTLRPHSRVIFETPKYLIGLPKTRCADYHKTLKERFAKNGFDVSGKYNPETDDYFVFTYG